MTAVFLDVDGTIVDSNLHHVLAWQRAFADLGRRVASPHLQRFIGIGGDAYVARVLGEEFERAYGDEARDAHDRYYAELAELVHPLPGAKELVDALIDRGVTVVLASSSGAEMVQKHARQVGIDLDQVLLVTADDLEQTKPAPDVYLTSLERAGVDASDALAVGDTVWDVRAATEAGVPAIAVTSDVSRPHDLRDAGAAAVYGSAQEIVESLDAALALTGAVPAGAHG